MTDEARPGVLVVDDDELLRVALGSALRRAGFTTHLAASGPEALDLYRRQGGIGAVLLDVSMPEMTGPQTLAALRAVNPAVRCCLMSGYDTQDVRGLGDDFLLKPFLLDEAVDVLWRLVGR
jgi:CheY-like chemotaxis protein